MKNNTQFKNVKTTAFFIVFLFFAISFANSVFAQHIKLLENNIVTTDAFYFWKADDPQPYHYVAAINPHDNCAKVSN